MQPPHSPSQLPPKPLRQSTALEHIHALRQIQFQHQERLHQIFGEQCKLFKSDASSCLNQLTSKFGETLPASIHRTDLGLRMPRRNARMTRSWVFQLCSRPSANFRATFMLDVQWLASTCADISSRDAFNGFSLQEAPAKKSPYAPPPRREV